MIFFHESTINNLCFEGFTFYVCYSILDLVRPDSKWTMPYPCYISQTTTSPRKFYLIPVVRELVFLNSFLKLNRKSAH